MGGCFFGTRLHYLQSLGSPDNMVPEPPAYGDTPTGLPSPRGRPGSSGVGEAPHTVRAGGAGGHPAGGPGSPDRSPAGRGLGPSSSWSRLRLQVQELPGATMVRAQVDISKSFWASPGRPAGLRHRLPGAGLLGFRKGYGLSAKDALLPRQGSEGRNWPGLGSLEAGGDSTWSPRGVVLVTPGPGQGRP